MLKHLSEEFLNHYPEKPEHMIPLSSFVFYRTYSRWLKEKGRRETFKEAIARAVNYSLSIAEKRMLSLGYLTAEQIERQLKGEAEALFDNIFNLKQFLSGRTHWVGGADTQIGDKFPMSNFNCAFTRIKNIKDIAEAFYLLLIGVGVGARLEEEDLKTMPLLRTNYELTHSEFKPVAKSERIETTKLVEFENSYAKIYVGDSKEGWVKAFEIFMELLSEFKYDHIKHIKISYNSIRPRGEKLNTFGGTASGHEPLKSMFTKLDMIIKGTLDESVPNKFVESNDIKYADLHTLNILDILCSIGENVVVGGVRRTALMISCAEDDTKIINAKKEFWKFPNLTHRAMSNNSIVFKTRPELSTLNEIFNSIKVNGEPGFINEEAAMNRRPSFHGTNPCGEILLDNKGLCNLTTVNVMAAIREKEGVPILDVNILQQLQRLSVRASMRMTLLDLELEEWNKVHKRDVLIGVSLTGWKDAMDKLNYDANQEKTLLEFLQMIAREEAVAYSFTLRIPLPLLTTTVKPEGTLSQVANGVSSGLHMSYAPYYIRRVRINSHDPLVKVAQELGWVINPEVGTPGETFEEKMANAMTLVLDFPVKSTSSRSADEQTAVEQLENYFMFQEYYTEHNSSVTIYVANDEWEEVAKMIHERWDEFIGVSFLPKEDHNYELAPYEKITKEKYEELFEIMKPFDAELLQKYEFNETERDEINIKGCDAGICPL